MFSNHVKKCFLLFFALCLSISQLVAHAEEATAITIKDYTGRKISLKSKPKRIVVMASQALVVLAQLKATDEIVGLDSRTLKYSSLFLPFKLYPNLEKVQDVGRNYNPNYEAILNVYPDVIILRGSKKDALLMEEKTKIPVIAVRFEEGYNYNIYHLLGSLCKKEKLANEVVSKIVEKKEELEKLIKKIPIKKRKKAYLMLQSTKKDFYQTVKNIQSFELAGVVNIATEKLPAISDWGSCVISKEEFILQNPQYIFLDYPISSISIQKENIFSDEVMKLVEATKSQQIYITHSFSLPKDYVYVVCEAYYYAHILYPHVVTEQIYKNAIDDVFFTIYGIESYYEYWTSSFN